MKQTLTRFWEECGTRPSHPGLLHEMGRPRGIWESRAPHIILLQVWQPDIPFASPQPDGAIQTVCVLDFAHYIKQRRSNQTNSWRGYDGRLPAITDLESGKYAGFAVVSWADPKEEDEGHWSMYAAWNIIYPIRGIYTRNNGDKYTRLLPPLTVEAFRLITNAAWDRTDA